MRLGPPAPSLGQKREALPDVVLAATKHSGTPPPATRRRSLNLSNAVAVAVFEAWRQQGFPSP